MCAVRSTNVVASDASYAASSKASESVAPSSCQSAGVYSSLLSPFPKQVIHAA